MSVPAISVDRLNKRYRDVHAVRDLSFEVEQGDIYGFLGPNGAGKTTTMRVLATLLKPDSGSAHVLGYDCVTNPREVRHRIGYMADSSGAYRDMLVYEYLEFFATAYHVPKSERRRIVDDSIELTGLMDKYHAPIEGLSRGMRQRLGLARCLINDPQVLILDEPASGLDPRARIEIQEVLRTLGKMGKTVFISSHILSELRFLCNKIGILESGELIYSGTIAEALARARTKRRLLIKTVDDHDKTRAFVEGFDEVVEAEIEDGEVLVELKAGIDDYSFVSERIVREGFRLLSIREEEILLEDAFIRLTDRTNPRPPLPGAPM